MRAVTIQPGKIWKARPLSRGFLENQWSAELYHHSANLNLSQLAFSEGDWKSWEWNAREALHLNNTGKKLPRLLASWFIPQLRVNFHLLHAYQNLISGWRQWEQLPHVYASDDTVEGSNLSFLLLSALGRLEQAEVKQNSFNQQKNKFLQSASLRQFRFYQQLASLLMDLNPVVKSAAGLLTCDNIATGSIKSLRDDILWHSKELSHLLGGFDQKPGFIKRLFFARNEINRLLGTACEYHSTYLKKIIEFHNP